jgi:thioesterase domain-containing protein
VPIGTNDDLFAIGGRSLTAVTLLTRVEEIWGRRFTPSILLENRPIAQLAGLLREKGQPPHPTLVRFNRVSDGVPLVCVHTGSGTGMYFRHLAKYFPDRPVVGLQLKSLEGSRPYRTYEAIADEYLEALAEFFPKRPVHLIGYCQGSSIAFVMANILEKTAYPSASFTSIDSPIWPKFEEAFAQVFPTGRASPLEFTGWVLFRFRRIFLRPLWWAIRDLRLVLSGKLSDRRILWEIWTWKMCKRALRRFRPQPINSNIHLIRSGEFAAIFGNNHQPEWEKYTRGKFTHEIVHADHATIMLEPQVQELVAPLLSRFDQAASEVQTSPPSKASID